MSKFICLIAALIFTSSIAHAAGDVFIPDPSKMQCALLKNPGQCNLYYDGDLIHEGPLQGEAFAGADCLECKNRKATALKYKMRLIMDRTRTWGDPNFLSLTSDQD